MASILQYVSLADVIGGTMSQQIYPAGPRQPNAQVAAAAAKPTRNRRLWIWMPVWSMGLLASVPFFRRAVLTRQRSDWLITAGYLFASILEIVFIALGGDSSTRNASPNALGDVGASLALLLMGAGATHVSVLYRQPDLMRADPQQDRNAVAVSEATQAARRRAEARRILEINPVMARDLKIGRPDLPRTYDDGGLIDVNHASPELLSRVLGWSLADARIVVDTRERTGGFSSLAEMIAYTELEPQRFDAVSDLLVFCPL